MFLSSWVFDPSRYLFRLVRVLTVSSRNAFSDSVSASLL